MGEVKVCEGRVWNGYRHEACVNRSKVERDGKHYCGVHDPVARKERDDRRAAEQRQEWEETKRMRDLAAAQRAEQERRAAAYDGLTAEVARLEAELARVREDLAKFQRFVFDVMPLDEEWIGDVDGGTLQDAAEKHGLIVGVEVTEACGEGCNCASYGDFPQTCFRSTDTMKRAIHVVIEDAATDAALAGGEEHERG